MKKEKLQAISLIIIVIIIIAIMCHMNNYYESYANFKCLQNGYKLAFPGKINNSGILNNNDNSDHTKNWLSYDGIKENRFTQMTLDNNSKTYLNNILGQILNHINNKTNSKYFLRNIDSINKDTIKQGSVNGYQLEREILTRITADFFAHELTKQETRRFLVIFTIDNDKNIDIEHINLSNAFKYNFMSNNSILSPPFSDDLIITDKAFNSNGVSNSIHGIDETKQDYSILNNIEKVTSKNYGYAKPNEVSQTIFLPNATHDTDNIYSNGFFPNRKHSGWWDSNGVALVEEPDCNKPKLGLDHGIENRPYQPYDNPTIARYKGESYKNKHHSNFDLSRGNFVNRVVSQ